MITDVPIILSNMFGFIPYYIMFYHVLSHILSIYIREIYGNIPMALSPHFSIHPLLASAMIPRVTAIFTQ